MLQQHLHNKRHRVAQTKAHRITLENLEPRLLLTNVIGLPEYQTITVNTVDDATHDPSLGITSLRLAIYQATYSYSPVKIVFDSTVFNSAQTITLNGNVLELTNTEHSITIQGPSAQLTIDAQQNSGIFKINQGVTANLNNLTLTNGSYSSGQYKYPNGAIENLGNLTLDHLNLTNNYGGGVVSEGPGPLTITNSTIANTQQGDTSSLYAGTGLVFYGSTLTLSNSTITGNYKNGVLHGGLSANVSNVTISNNTATGFYNLGQDTDNNLTHATANLNNVTITGNQGNGFYNYGATATLNNSTITTSTGVGFYNTGIYNNTNIGGIATLTNVTLASNLSNGFFNANYDSESATLTNVTISNNADTGFINAGGNATLTNVTLTGNTGSGSGGGLLAGSGTLALRNMTVTNNHAPTGGGGGIVLYSTAVATITNVTIYNNTAGHGGGIYNTTSSNLRLANTVVAGNTSADGNDVKGGITSSGHNFIGNADGSSNWTSTDRVGTTASPLNPNLAPLAFNGGYTMTLLPYNNSPLLNQGSNTLIPAGLTTDQRGLARIANSTVDIGAVERQTSDNVACQNFVTHVYQDALRRAPDAGGFTTWTTALLNGALTTTQVAASFMASTEYRTLLINQAYQHILGRAPDPSGFNSWLNFLAAGRSPEQMQAGMYGSAEYYARHGSANTTLLTAFYQDILGRAPDAAGYANWLNLLNTGTSATQVAFSMLCRNQEGATIIVTNSYVTYLHRQPDPSGLQTWIPQVYNGVSALTININLMGSAEYYNRS